MKSNLEHSIKESLGNFEMPYNADAWAKMSSKLDAKATSGSEGAATAAGSVGVVEAIRQSLENAEMPYNPSAWDAMKSKLDATKPVAQTGGSNLKWFVAASRSKSLIVPGVRGSALQAYVRHSRAAKHRAWAAPIPSASSIAHQVSSIKQTHQALNNKP